MRNNFMNFREKLIELFYENNIRCDQTVEYLADLPTADVAPKSETAREIFEEIENIIQKSKYKQAWPFGTEERYNPYVIIKQIAELKKKYTDGENDR